MQLQVTDKYIDTAPISRLITQGENGVDVITIPLPKMRGEVDLSELTYTMRGVSEKETLAAQVLEKTLDGEMLLLKWNITSDFTAVAGGLTLSITGVNASGEQIIHYNAGAISIRKTPAKDFAPPQLDIFEQLLTQAQAALQAATTQAEKAKAEADRLAEFGISFKVLGFYPTLAALETAAPTPAQGDAYGVGETPVYVYLWNGNAWQRGQPLAIDLTEYYTKATTDSIFATQSEVATQKEKTDKEVASLKDTKADKVLTLSDIGISNLPTSMIQIIEAMPDGSSLQYTPAAIHVEGVFPSNSGTLYINRINSLRVDAHFFVSGISKAYLGRYRQDEGWAGWKEIPTIESGTWTPVLLNIEGEKPVYTVSHMTAGFEIIGRLIHIWANLQDIKMTNVGIGWSTLGGLPRIPVSTATTIANVISLTGLPKNIVSVMDRVSRSIFAPRERSPWSNR